MRTRQVLGISDPKSQNSGLAWYEISWNMANIPEPQIVYVVLLSSHEG